MLHRTIRILETLLRLLQPVPSVPADYRLPPPPGREPSGPARERPLWLAMYGVDVRRCPGCGVGWVL
ncbi:hypothetical protein ACFYY2_20890 [Streptomyces sp. NPDC001822]|uniref:hypothetical protein n=1 Tax=Streptomyces sp. NPDC001822 TaxID=3364614 RepID=UPI0036B42516